MNFINEKDISLSTNKEYLYQLIVLFNEKLNIKHSNYDYYLKLRDLAIQKLKSLN